jgi:hypothetical protein
MIAPGFYAFCDPHLKLALSERSPLLKIAVVSAHRGVPNREIYEEVAAGTLRWVFNVAAAGRGGMPDYRFWSPEIAGENIQRIRVETVIRKILGERARFRPGELCVLLAISRPTLKLLRGQLGGHLSRRGRAAYFRRAGVEKFLRGRLLANSIPPVGKKCGVREAGSARGRLGGAKGVGSAHGF